MKLSLGKRFVIATFSMMLAAGMLAMCFAGLAFNGRINRNHMENQRIIAEKMLELAAHTDYTISEIIALCIHDPYSAERTSRAFDGEMAFAFKRAFVGAETLVRLRGEGVRIYVVLEKPAVLYFFFGIVTTALGAVVMGTIIAGVFGRRLLRPINELVEGIERIAQGDFSVRVRVWYGKGLFKLMRSFNRMAEDLAGLESLRTDFVNDVSHEFRTPLASIQGFAKLLLDPDLSKEDRMEYAEVIEREAKRLSSLSSDVLKLSRLENQTIVADRAWYSLDEQLRQAVLSQEPVWSRKKLDMHVDTPPLRYFGSEELLWLVFTNLLGNAIKFTPEGGSVSVRLIDAEDAVIVRIKDTGIGMDAQTQAHIFEKFYQGDPSHAREGAGLGLAMVKRIVNLCGGEVTVRSEPSQGSAFSVKLPVVKTE